MLAIFLLVLKNLKHYKYDNKGDLLRKISSGNSEQSKKLKEIIDSGKV